jgi:hypothetical protein
MSCLNPRLSPITSTTFRLLDVAVSRGRFGMGTGLASGRKGRAYGCNGVALIGTAAVSSGPLSATTNTDRIAGSEWGDQLPPLAGFQLFTIGRIWVFTEALTYRTQIMR